MSRHRHARRLGGTQQFTACLSTTLVLVLLGTIMVLVLASRNLSDYVRENINVSALLSDETDSVGGASLADTLRGAPWCREATFVSQQAALSTLTSEMGVDPSDFLDHNPLTASIELRIRAASANNDSLSRIATRLKALPQVVDVIYEKELMRSVNDNLSRVSALLLVVALLFTYISFQLINNTVLLTIFARRFAINTMKLVGASWAFIRRPFLASALRLGLTSALLASALLAAGLHYAGRLEPEMATVFTPRDLALTLGALLVFGLAITLACTYFSLSRCLRMSSSDLYSV